MTHLVLLLGFFCLSSFSYAAEPVSPNEQPELFKKLLRSYSESAIEGIDEAIPLLRKTAGAGFTAAHDSKSSQGAKRVLHFGLDASVVTAIAEGNELEMAVHTSGKDGVVGLAGHFENGKFTYSRSNDCAFCHTADFTYIFRQYNQWPELLGANDDLQSANAKEFKAVREDKRFRQFFVDDKKGDKKDSPDSPARSPAYPYYDTDVAPASGDSVHKPNNQFVDLLARRAALSILQRIKGRNAEKYKAVRKALLLFLACGYRFPDLPTSDVYDAFAALFRKNNPAEFARWQTIRDEANQQKTRVRDIEAMMILDYLGIPPQSIILNMPWRGNKVLDSFEGYQNFMDTQGYLGEGSVASPLGYNANGIVFAWFLAGAIEQETPMRTFTNSPAKYSEYYSPKVDRFKGAKNLKVLEDLLVFASAEVDECRALIPLALNDLKTGAPVSDPASTPGPASQNGSSPPRKLKNHSHDKAALPKR